MSSRLQLALNVSNLDEAIKFYSAMFSTAPAKVREGYANFAIADPPLKLVLIETPHVAGEAYPRINHLGVEMESSGEVETAISHFEKLGLVDSVEKESTCCFAVQDKVWVHDPDGVNWEYYTVLADAESVSGNINSAAAGGGCC